MASRIGKSEWIGVFIVTGAIDIAQWVIDFTGVGIGINEVADPLIGVGLAGYFQIRGVSMIAHPMRLIAIVAGDVAEQLSASVMPAWILDVWYVYTTVKREETQIKAQQEQQEFLQSNIRQPYNQGGIRSPRTTEPTTSSQPSNMDGIRAPGGGLN